MIKAVLFDMNGIIINDEHIHEKIFQETVKKNGIKLSHEDYLLCCAGKADRKGYEDIAKNFKVDLDIEFLLEEKFKMYPEFFHQHKKIYEGITQLIKDIKQLYVVALTSSSSRAEVDLVINEFNIKNYFTVTVSADDIKNSKPDPEPYIKTVQMLGLNADECVVVEDSASGVKSAKSAGCYCIAITTTHTKVDLYEADIIVESFSEINQRLIDNIKR